MVKESWSIVSTLDKETVGGLFYKRLFEIMPEVQPMFSRASMAEQSKKLLSMLSYIISKLDKLDEILDEVVKLAQRHNKYGVEDTHYNAVGSALLWTLEQGLGDKWSDELEAAWTDIYTVLAGAMMTAQHEALNEALVY